jgi:hypothetical protein
MGVDSCQAIKTGPGGSHQINLPLRRRLDAGHRRRGDLAGLDPRELGLLAEDGSILAGRLVAHPRQPRADPVGPTLTPA